MIISSRRDIFHFLREFIGELAQEYVTGADDSRAQWYPDNDAVADASHAMLQDGDLVLVKGSRAMKMEEIVAALTK